MNRREFLGGVAMLVSSGDQQRIVADERPILAYSRVVGVRVMVPNISAPYWWYTPSLGNRLCLRRVLVRWGHGVETGPYYLGFRVYACSGVPQVVGDLSAAEEVLPLWGAGGMSYWYVESASGVMDFTMQRFFEGRGLRFLVVGWCSSVNAVNGFIDGAFEISEG